MSARRGLFVISRSSLERFFYNPILKKAADAAPDLFPIDWIRDLLTLTFNLKTFYIE